MRDAERGTSVLPASTVATPTPVLTCRLDVAGVERRLHLKAEWFGSLGSSKGRTAVALLASVIDRVDPRSGIIESTSGNLGLALATLCHQHRIAFTAVVDPRTSRVLVDRMRALGARIVEATTEDGHGGYLLNRLALVRTALRRDPRLVWTNQYGNPANPAAHAGGTAPELASQVPGAQEVLIPVSTGGTLAGFRAHAEASAPGWRCVGVDVVGSAALGGPLGERVLSGIGSSRRSSFLPATTIEAEHVTPSEAIGACVWVDETLGVGIGGSGGAAVAAAVRRMQAHPALTDVACVCPDSASAYQETIWSESWRAERGLWPARIDTEVVAGRAS